MLINKSWHNYMEFIYFKRINTFTEQIFEKRYDKVLVVCHGGTSQLLLEILLKPE